jgi:hypothetical protein
MVNIYNLRIKYEDSSTVRYNNAALLLFKCTHEPLQHKGLTFYGQNLFKTEVVPRSKHGPAVLLKPIS